MILCSSCDAVLFAQIASCALSIPVEASKEEQAGDGTMKAQGPLRQLHYSSPNDARV